MLQQQVWISPKAKRIHLHRFLLSKFCFKLEELTLRDICCLFENQLWLEQKCLTDFEFYQKFGTSLEEVSIILKEFNFRTKKTDLALRRLSKKLQESVPDLIIPKRNYKDTKKRLNGTYQLIDPKPYGVAKRKVTPTARIGKGYRDKGSARDLAKDGSPGWQEVATHQGPIYHKGKLINETQDSPPTKRRGETIFLKRINAKKDK